VKRRPGRSAFRLGELSVPKCRQETLADATHKSCQGKQVPPIAVDLHPGGTVGIDVSA